jgi:hypothetical protein
VPARRLAGGVGVTVIGAGALANWFGLSLGLSLGLAGSRRDKASRLRGLAQTPVVASCPDNFEVRCLLNDWVRGSGGRVLVNGGTSAWGGSSMTYAPGTTCCLSCLMDIEGLARRESEAQGCGRVVEASVVTSNAIVGALMAWAVRELFRHRRVRAGIWEYDGPSAWRGRSAHRTGTDR